MSQEVEQYVETYMEVRERMRELDERYKKEKEPLLEAQNLISGWLMDYMENNGLKNFKTNAGMCGTTTKYSASLADPQAFMDYIKANNAFELLDRKANVNAVKEYIKENNAPPPGCNLSSFKMITVRKGKTPVDLETEN